MEDGSVARIQRAAAFRAALRRFELATDAVTRRAGLTSRQYVLCLAIEGAVSGERRADIGAIAEALGVAHNTASEFVDRTERAGLVRRETAAHDGRVVYVSLTRRGRSRLNKALEALEIERQTIAHAADALREHLDPIAG